MTTPREDMLDDWYMVKRFVSEFSSFRASVTQAAVERLDAHMKRIAVQARLEKQKERRSANG